MHSRKKGEAFAKADSITHLHLLSIINTELKHLNSFTMENDNIIRILDAGCGNGKTICYLKKNIILLNPNVKFEFYGFDINNSGVQNKGYFKNTIELLSKHFPDDPWENRLRFFSDKEPWPYLDNFFHFIISNQVLEHVQNHEAFFFEVNRTLCREGYSFHLFPLKHYIREGHLHLPFVHRIYNYDFLIGYIKMLSQFRLGKFKAHKETTSVSLNEFTERHADYMIYFTKYLSYTETLKLGKKYSMRASYRYTQEFYYSKLRSMLGFNPTYKYNNKRLCFVDWLAVHFLKYVGCVTLVLHKKESYTTNR